MLVGQKKKDDKFATGLDWTGHTKKKHTIVAGGKNVYLNKLSHHHHQTESNANNQTTI